MILTSFSDCHKKQPASQNALSYQSRSWEKTVIGLVYLKRQGAKVKGGEDSGYAILFPD